MISFKQFFKEAISRRGFLGTLGKAAAATGISPKLPIPNLRDDDDDYDDYDDYDDWEGYDVQGWIIDNVLDNIDDAIGDVEISDELARNINKELISIFKQRDGDDFTKYLEDLFGDLMDRETQLGKRFFDVLDDADSEWSANTVSDMREDIYHKFNLPQIIAKAAAREAMGHKQEDIMKDVKAELNDPNQVQADPNQIKYSKFDTAGGTKEYNYTADSYIMSNKDGKMLSEAYLNEIAFAKNVNYNDDDRVKDTLHDVADRKDKKKWKFDPLNPESKDGYHEEGEESLKKVIDKTFALNLPGLDELNVDIAHLDMFVSYDRKVFKLLKITGLINTE